MEKNKKSYQKIFTFVNNARGYLQINKDETKLKYALERTLESLNSNIKTYQNAISDLKLDHAFEDDKGVVPFTIDITTKERVYQYGKEDLKALDKATEELFNSEVEIDVHYATDLPENFNEDFREVFEGFVIREEKAPKTKK